VTKPKITAAERKRRIKQIKAENVALKRLNDLSAIKARVLADSAKIERRPGRTDKLAIIKLKKNLAKEEFKKQVEEVMLADCNGCDATGKCEVEVYLRIYETRKCDICNGTGKRLSDFARELFKGRS
jgi:hypothetical protein